MNKFIKMLKENWIGAVIGGIIFYMFPTIIIIQIPSINISPTTRIGDIISILLGIIIGAFIQSKVRR